MKVKLLKPWAGYGGGSVVDITWDDGIARMLIEKGYAEKVRPATPEDHRPETRPRRLSDGHRT